MKEQKTLLQYFEWYLPADSAHWKRAAREARALRQAGFTGVWLPPAYKANGGVNDVGYGVYDLYDLGEFDQKGTVPTKYGTRADYLDAIRALQQEGLEVLADVVLNHKMGADFSQQVQAVRCSAADRAKGAEKAQTITAWTGFNFPGRKGTYSDFCWNYTHFDGVDWDDSTKTSALFRLAGKQWDDEVDREHGNYDYLMGADLDMRSPEVLAELERWGEWYLNTTGVDGLRLDAVKHIRFTFYARWLEHMRRKTGRELWSVGEYWSPELAAQTNYLDRCGNVMSLFDVPLHYNFARASSGGGNYDMRRIFDGTLVKTRPDRAVTFVDNHDTQPGQALQSWVQGWFKPLAYALILLRRDGVPCVFYGDRYGIPHDDIEPVGKPLERMLRARQERAWGEQRDYLDDCNVIGWVRQGDEEHPGSGLAVVMSEGPEGKKKMNMGIKFAGTVFVDLLENCPGQVVLDEVGTGLFPVMGGSVSVWVPRLTV